MDLQLRGKTALITGGSRGIGKAIARALLAEGVDVALAARGREALDATATELAASGGRVVALAADMRDTAAVNQMVADAIGQLGRVDILVNNAARVGGAPARSGIEFLEDELLMTEVDTKVLGYIRCARAVAPSMKANGWGRIINISGLAARQSGNPVGSIRNASVAALTKNLADELGPFGVNVTCVHPGLTWTEGVEERIRAQATAGGRSYDEIRAGMAEGNSIRRIVDATDIANLVTFLASPLSVSITGDSIAAGGGAPRAIYY
jgi:NAD(P)-dependent dehydrogenase (short-subunit alcohol dehydrogenase family)